MTNSITSKILSDIREGRKSKLPRPGTNLLREGKKSKLPRSGTNPKGKEAKKNNITTFKTRVQQIQTNEINVILDYNFDTKMHRTT